MQGFQDCLLWQNLKSWIISSWCPSHHSCFWVQCSEAQSGRKSLTWETFFHPGQCLPRRAATRHTFTQPHFTRREGQRPLVVPLDRGSGVWKQPWGALCSSMASQIQGGRRGREMGHHAGNWGPSASQTLVVMGGNWATEMLKKKESDTVCNIHRLES
jgi:hypothetical protein